MSDGERFTGSRPWRVWVATGEGVRSALAGRWLSAASVLLVCWVGAVPGAVDAATVARLVDDEQRFLAAGGNVVVVENREAGVPQRACAQLAAADGIAGSTALTRLDEPVTLSAARGGDLAVFAVTSGVWRLLGAEASPTRVGIVPASIAGRVGLADGDWLRLERSPGTRGGWFPDEQMRVTVADTRILSEEYRGLLLPTVVTAGVTADACVVAAEPNHLSALKASLPAALASGSGQPVIRERLFTGEFTTDYALSYRQRPLQWAWVAAGCLLGLVWLLVRWVRRGDDALYATLGADAANRLLLLRVTEWVVLAGLGGVWAIALGVAGAMAAGARFSLAATHVVHHVGAALLVATAFVLISQVCRPRSLLADLKDR